MEPLIKSESIAANMIRKVIVISVLMVLEACGAIGVIITKGTEVSWFVNTVFVIITMCVIRLLLLFAERKWRLDENYN